MLSHEMKRMLPAGNGCVLAVGLGNRHITADSIGPKVVERLLVTRHIKEEQQELFSHAGFGELAACAFGVLGQTGIESAELVIGAAERIRPRCIIAIDALASRRLERLASTIQLSDTGIRPGSGVANHRTALTKETLGVPVISVGIPTVVDAATLAYDLLEEFALQEGLSSDNSLPQKISEGLHGGAGKDFFVTPKDSDVLIATAAKLISTAINLAVHDGLTLQELAEYQSGT
jgi:spore protease